MLFQRFDPAVGRHAFGHHGFWLFGLLPLILWVVLIGVVIWAVLRVTSRHGLAMAPAAPGPHGPPGPRPDGALEELRLRYARGEMSREEFLQRSSDLGGTPPRPIDPGQTDAG
jgi:putative membrane protein